MFKAITFVNIMTLSIGLAYNIWTETTQQDFNDGFYEKNIYASMKNGGTIEFSQRFDLNNDGYIDIITCDIGGPYVIIHLGSSSGFSSNNQIRFNASGAGNCEVGDINFDGYNDFVVSHCNSDSRIAIYWGTNSGPSPYNSFNIANSPSVPNEVVYLADLNKDGYLDIITGTYNSLYNGAIFWGSTNGFHVSNRTDLPTVFGAHNTEVADLNNDGWLDVIFINNSASQNYIYWGSSSGFSPNNKSLLAAPPNTPHGATIADLNNDNFLDLVFTSVYSNYSYIYYGASTGYSNYQLLMTGSTYGGSSACDFNNDNYLDIVFFRGWPSTLKPIIYWGSSNGFSDNNRTEVGSPTNASGGFVADLNLDGKKDIFINSRSGVSPIFWGPDYQSCFSIAVNHDHHAMFREIGNVYDRGYYEDYISSVFDASETVDWDIIEWDADCPSGSEVWFWLRSGNTPTPDQSWSEWCTVENGGSIPSMLDARYLQYKTRLSYTNPCYLPALDEVRVFYNTAQVIPATVRIEPRTIYFKREGRFTAFITLPIPYSHYEIDVTTVEVEGAWAINGHATPEHFIAKFLIDDLVGVIPGPAVLFTLHGQLFDGTPFCGTDIVRVIGNAIITDRPNSPFFEALTITLSANNNEPVTVKIYDINGKVIRDLGFTYHIANKITITWDHCDNSGRRMPAGIYFIKASSEHVHIIEKLVKIK